ncbi:MAG: T9SS type A sorting domain-containing protein [Sphingobacteriales bacterium]|nr:MAG: T9SS type A sorting domain-containing protein [Sphingobacteriales bacterium]
MKKVQLLCGLLSLSLAHSASAQVVKTPTPVEYRNMVLASVKKAAAATAAAKTTGTDQRLKAYATYFTAPDPRQIDTAAFFYSGTNKSSFNKAEMDFLPFDYTPEASPVIDMSPLLPRTDQMENEYDSAYSFSFDTDAQALVQRSTIHVTYAAPKQPSVYATTEYPGTGDMMYKTLCSYDANDHLVKAVTLMEDMGVWDTTMVRHFVYNAQGRVSRDSARMYFGGMAIDFLKYEYTYDPSGKLTALRSYMGFTGSWMENARITLGWNGQGRVSTITTEEGGMGGFTVISFDSLGYNTAGNLITYRLTREADQNGLQVNKAYNTLHVNSAGMPDTGYAYRYTSTGWDLEEKSWIVYNSYQNPETKTITRLNLDGSIYEQEKKKYYYELFNTTTAVDDVTNAGQFTVYPNPASESIRIKSDASHAGGRLYIMNTAGQTLRNEPYPGTTPVRIADMPAGQYFIIIKDEQGVLKHRQSFIKM